MKLFWKFDEWCGRWPSRGSDEMYRHTIVIPYLFPYRVDLDDGPIFRAICFVVAPWWLCPFARRKAYRTFVRWERGLNKLVNLIPEVVEEELYGKLFDDIYDGYVAKHGPQPDAMEAFGF
jgi:hypothetical protein